jgi:probable phosphoglycerate mutase
MLADLNDIDYGTWQGRTREDVCRTFPTEYRRWLKFPYLVRFPSGESLSQLSVRVADVVRHVIDNHPGNTIVLVGHDSTNRALLLQALGLPLSRYWGIAQDPCGLSEIVLNDDGMSVLRMNETAHLSTIDSTLVQASKAPSL